MIESFRYVGLDSRGNPQSWTWDRHNALSLWDWERSFTDGGAKFFGRGDAWEVPIVDSERKLLQAMELITQRNYRGDIDWDVNMAEWEPWAYQRGVKVLSLPGRSNQLLPGPRKPPPAIPPEIWNTRPVDPELAMEAVRASSKSGGS